MDIPLGHDAGERGRDPQVVFHVTNGIERLPGRFDTLFGGDHLCRAGIGGLPGDLDVVSRNHAWRGRRGLEPDERALVGVSLRARHRKLGLCALQFRLRFRPLRHEFWRLQRSQQIAGADPRSSVNADGLYEPGHPRKDIDGLKRGQLAW